MEALRRFVWHPLLLPVVYIYGFYLATAAPLDRLPRPLLVGLVLAVVVYAACLLALRGLQPAAFAASGLLLGFAGFGWAPVVIGLMGGVVGAYPPLRRLVRQRLPRAEGHTINRGIDTVAGVLLLILVVQGIPNLAPPAPSPEPPPVLAGRGPNIQVVILDGYARQDTLADWGFDNGPFVDALEARGFDVYDQARSSYRSTGVVIASVVRMAHVPDMPIDAPHGAVAQWRALRLLTEDVPALTALRTAGYEVRVVDARVEHTRIGPADVVYGREYPTAFELALFQKTMAAGILQVVAPDLLPGLHRARIDAALGSLAHPADGPPRFTIAHVVAPHPPFVYAADGSLPDQPACFPASCSFYGGSAAELSMSNDEFIRRYTDQISGLNPVVLDALDDVIRADPDAVIVLMSDHGSRYDGASDPLERYRPLFAARTPGHPNLFGDEPSNTQALAVILNAYLGAEVPVPGNQRFEEYGPLEVSPLPEE